MIEEDADGEAKVLTADTASTATITLIAIAGGTLLLIIVAVVLVRGGIVRPIHAMIEATSDLGHGKLDEPVRRRAEG